MKRVLLVGLDPATVDFSDPALPQGMNADNIHAGVKVALADMAERGWQAENCFINPDETAAMHRIEADFQRARTALVKEIGKARSLIQSAHKEASAGLKGAMDWIKTGDQIEVDGAAGTVRKLDA